MPKPKQLYFVSRLELEHAAYSEGQHFEIQIFDKHGYTRHLTYFGDTETTLTVQGKVISQPVLEAARRQIAGQGDYVNKKEESVPPF